MRGFTIPQLENDLLGIIGEKEYRKFEHGVRCLTDCFVNSKIWNRQKYPHWVNIPNKHLRAWIGVHKAKPLLELLETNDFIRINNRYSKEKKFCKSYLLRDKYYNAKINREPLRKHREVDKTYWEPVHHHLFSYLCGLTLSDIPARVMEQVHESQILLVEQFRDKDFRAVIDKNGRFHTNLTNMARLIRPYLLYYDSPLVGIDIKNSQPLLLYHLIKSISEPLTLEEMPLVENSSITQSRYTKTDRVTYTICCSLFELERFGRLCENGECYSFFLNKLKEDYGKVVRNKKQFKKTVLGALFDNWENPACEWDTLKIWKEYFPTLYNVCAQIKFDDYTQLANRLQRKESNLIIGKVCAYLMKEYPHIPIFTIHDSIYTTPDHISTIKHHTTRIFNEHGIYPQFHDD